jgi:6-phosphogluconolactonase
MDSEGRLSAFQTISTLPEGHTERNTCSQIQITSDGRFLFVPNRGHNSIVIFRVDSETGRLERVGWEQADGLIRIPRNFAIDSSGRLLLVANQDADSILIFQIGSDGRLTRIGDPIPTSEKPTFVGIFDRID